MTTKTLKASKGNTKDEKREKPSEEDLRLAAYYRWLSRGCPPGDDVTDWVAVEEEFQAEAKNRSTHDQ